MEKFIIQADLKKIGKVDILAITQLKIGSEDEARKKLIEG